MYKRTFNAKFTHFPVSFLIKSIHPSSLQFQSNQIVKPKEKSAIKAKKITERCEDLRSILMRLHQCTHESEILLKESDESWKRGLEIYKPSLQDLDIAPVQLTQQVNQMLAFIEHTQEREPTLEQGLPQLEDFAERQRRILKKGNEQLPFFLKVSETCRQCLALIAKMWGYNNPDWLEDALPLIGYSKTALRASHSQSSSVHKEVLSEKICASRFEQLEPTLCAIRGICNRAVMCGNLKALETALAFAPRSMIRKQDYSIGKGDNWGFLQHTEDRVPFALRLASTRRWIKIEFNCFAACYGTLNAITMKTISPAFDLDMEISELNREKMFSSISFHSPGITCKQMWKEITVRAELQLESLRATFTPQLELEPRILYAIEEEKLSHFPFHMSGWRILPRKRPKLETIDERHIKMHAQVKTPWDTNFKRLSMATSPFEAASQLIYGLGGQAADIKGFLIDFLSQAGHFLKSKKSIIQLLAPLETTKATLFISEVDLARERCFSTWLAICTLIAHLYDVQLHLGSLLDLPYQETKQLVKELDDQIVCCGIESIEKIADFRDLGENQTSISLILNSDRSGGGSLFFNEGITRHRPIVAGNRPCSFSGFPDDLEKASILSKELFKKTRDVSLFLYYYCSH